MVGRTNASPGSPFEKYKTITGTIRGAGSRTMTITGIPFTPKTYSISANKDYMGDYGISGMFSGTCSYGYGWAPPENDYNVVATTSTSATPFPMAYATYSNGTLTVTCPDNELAFHAYDFTYIITG